MYMIDFINMPFDYKGSNYGSSHKKEVFDEDSLTSDDMLEKYNNMLHDFVSEKSQYNKVKSQYDIKR